MPAIGHVAVDGVAGIAVGVLFPLDQEHLHGLDLGSLGGGDLLGQFDDLGIGGPVRNQCRHFDGLLVVRNHVGGERDVIGVESGGLRGHRGLLGVFEFGVAVGSGAVTGGQEQGGGQSGQDCGDASDDGRHDTTLPDTPPGYR